MSEDTDEEEWEKCYLKLGDENFVINEEYVTESRPLRMFYRFGSRGPIPAPIEGKSSTIIRKALQFCKERGEIRNKYEKHDEKILQQKLKVFDNNFFQQNKTDAFDLADIACRLQIRSLYYLMREAAADMLAQKTDDDIYKLFKIHYDENKTTDPDIEKMRTVVRNAAWAFK